MGAAQYLQGLLPQLQVLELFTGCGALEVEAAVGEADLIGAVEFAEAVDTLLEVFQSQSVCQGSFPR
jgi:16S rRNA G966 N2-methylase RsmD